MWDMFFKSRNEPEELILLKYLTYRMDLLPKDKLNLFNLEKGFKGEQKFDLLLENLPKEWLVLNDLLLKYKNNYFQIDTLLISQNTIYLIDVKNYEGDFYIEGDHWYTIPKVEITNPLYQLKRCESLTRRFLRDLGFNFSIESHLVFINPEFQLYQSSLSIPAIFPTQLNRFMTKLIEMPIDLRDKHFKLAKQLAASHLDKSPFTQLPEYSYETLKKGIHCGRCHSFVVDLQMSNLICAECGFEEDVQAAVLRSTKEFILLFPNRKITTKAIFEWCTVIKSKKTILRVLSGNFKIMGNNRKYTYFC